MATMFSLGLPNLVPALLLVHFHDFIHPVKNSSSHESSAIFGMNVNLMKIPHAFTLLLIQPVSMG